MGARSSIEWTDATWSPVTGCTRVSDGCTNCYIDRTPPFRMAGRRFGGPEIGASTGVQLHPERISKPLRWREPRKVFVCSMADLFHEDVPDNFIGAVFDIMAKAERHTFQVLTKRPARMRALLTKWATQVPDDLPQYKAAFQSQGGQWSMVKEWPLPNVWVGVSAENQLWATTRIPMLLDTPAAVRFVSAEPLLGALHLDQWLTPECEDGGVDWVIAGGESGPGARPMHPDWARGLRDQCQNAGVPFLFKQWGEYRPGIPGVDTWDQVESVAAYPDVPMTPGFDPGLTEMRRVGKKAAGRELDGRTWDEYPGVARV